ncbi:MAG: hypothetical protein JRI68_09390 [Deltaproteobacteria bacterium]|nr:hypothetical protein [Deltaproteobacteria bacterium]
MQHQLTSRDEFHAKLAEMLAEVGRLISERPKNEVLDTIEIQLDAMRRWTADGRTPTKEDRAWPELGPISFTQLDPKQEDLEFSAIKPWLSELHWYFYDWPKL